MGEKGLNNGLKNKEVQLIELLTWEIGGEKRISLNSKDINWKEIIHEAECHGIEALIYSSAKRNGLLNNIDDKLLNMWIKKTIITAVGQCNHINTISYVLRKFNEESIPVIVLKGLVLRDLYPNPEFRAMGDADILVHKEDLKKVGDILISLGYEECKKNEQIEEGHEKGAHIVFVKSGFKKIEVHWTLINNEFFIGNKDFEKSIWDNTMKVKVAGVDALSLGLEDLLLHLCVHMAVHMGCGGFGLRQLSDVFVLVEKRKDQINWTSFMEKVKASGVEKFITAIFFCCNRLFHMKLPEEILNNQVNIKNYYVDLLIEDILDSGVYGKKTANKSFSSNIAYNNKGFFKLLFPSVEDMSDKYKYAKKNRFLIPIALIHHFFNGVLSKEYNLKDKVQFLFLTAKVAKKREKLLYGLELK